MNARRISNLVLNLIVVACLFGAASPAGAGVRLENICRLKGQEENSLQGLGLVIGLSGTGDSSDYLPTIRSLATALQLLGSPVGPQGAVDLKKAKNVALVVVTATVPAAGARQGDVLDCAVSSVGDAKSLAGGRLFLTALVGPQVENPKVYAIAEGAVQLDDPRSTRAGKVPHGCRLEEDFLNLFSLDGKITLVLDKHRASFETAQEIASALNSAPLAWGSQLARAINPGNVEVVIPPTYQEDPVDFIAQVLAVEIFDAHPDARVVINERTGSIVIGADVEIGPVAVTHKNLVVETGGNAASSRFVEVDANSPQNTKLQTLVETLNAIKVPTADIIEIIKRLERSGDLHGWLIVE